jgi:hypothetical protein
MKDFLNRLKSNWGLAFVAIVCIVFMFAEINNHRFWLSDFEVYYRAALRLIHGQPLYNVYYEDPFYIYKYSPVAPLFFTPFTIFSLETAKIVYWLFLTAVILLSFILASKAIVPKQPISKHNAIYIFATLILALHFLRELHLGQVNYLLFTGYVTICYLYIRGQRTASSILLAITIFFKPFGLIFIPYLLVKKNYRELALTFCSLLILFFVPFLFYRSGAEFIGLYKGWVHELMVEMSHKQSLLQDGNHTIFSVVARYTPVKYLLTTDVLSKIYQVIVLGIIALLYFFYQKRDKQENRFIVNNFAFLVLLIPLFSFTSENAFCFSGLAVISILMNFNTLNLPERIISIFGFIGIGGNFSELLGQQTSKYLDNISLISFGAIALLTVLFTTRARNAM